MHRQHKRNRSTQNRSMQNRSTHHRATRNRNLLNRGLLNRGLLNRGLLNRGLLNRGTRNRTPQSRSMHDRGTRNRNPLNRGQLNRGRAALQRRVKRGERARALARWSWLLQSARYALNSICNTATPAPAVTFHPKKGISAPGLTNRTHSLFSTCGKSGLNPASSPSLLGIQPIVFPS